MKFTIRQIRDKKDLRTFLRLRYQTEARTTSGNNFHVLVEYDTEEAIKLIEAMIKKYKNIPKHARFIPKWEAHIKTILEMEANHASKN